MKYLMIILILYCSSIVAQIVTPIAEFGNFTSASSFDIDLNGNLFVSDISENTISKFDSLGNLILSIGGYGWEESSFDEPISIITNTLSVYVADKNNHRVQRFDKDLNFLSLYSGDNDNSEVEFAYPTCLEISNIGDLFVLETDNNRILKFNLTGEYLTEIGANDAGDFVLNDPQNFTTDKRGNLFVLDENRIKVFDQYGNGEFTFKINDNPKKISISNDNLIYIYSNCLRIFNLQDRKVITEFKNLIDEEIVDVKFFGSILYILSESKISKFKVSS